jgi:isopentenyl-diphosphate delta-isomerase
MQEQMNLHNQVILVDANDQPIGTEEKLTAHREGKLHRAFSVFTFNAQGHMLIHQRAHGKYHTGGLWTNTCCSHPRPGEDTLSAAHRRLQEEMGFDCELQEIFSFIYKVHFASDNLFEHEFDHVLIGYSDAVPTPNPGEVAAFKWVDVDWLVADVQAQPENYTFWFKEALDRVVKVVAKNS